MTKKRPQKKTAPTDELNILPVQPSPQKVEPEDVQPVADKIENPVDDAASTPVPVEARTIDFSSSEPSLDTSSVPVTFDPPTSEIAPEQSDSSASSHEEPPALFQAVGILTGDVTIDEEKTFVSVGGKTYPLYYSSYHKRALAALKKEIETTGIREQKLIVYPKITHYPGGKQPYSVGFQLVGFVGHQASGMGVSSDLQDLEFKICGLWQFIPVCRIPCISVFKNFNQQRLEFIKSAQAELKVNFMKASHIPVLWRDAPVPPFRFNPKLEKEAQGKAFFVQIKARFNSERNTFEFVSLLAIPSSEPPNYLKAGKKDKLEVAKTRLAASKARQHDEARSHNDAVLPPRRTTSAPKPKPKPKVVAQE
ncbi:hypothetical protein NDI44_28285 [Trichocoleus sp. DQ-A3]|uniref:hypothetical protein n=1 Tax=Cyanophyceae TaxID=3028117 RepID=UPI001682A237|nr:hypothetical protein [Coleofasciculus sp. FACHB-125]MBD1903647.1 hypothetical protein [Coleofasciculus sp. FACHB-125]